MQFSTTTALAAVAIFAGQTLAACWQVHVPDAKTAQHKCADGNGWTCGDAAIGAVGDVYIYTTKKTPQTLEVRCVYGTPPGQSAPSTTLAYMLHCDAKSVDKFQFHCPTGEFQFFYWK
ncbi:hypothetical protein E4U53_001992 [Claviceps sorghi]|nr:hypothetical protein E4U53_001992 [Claviceps sorghi]